MPDQDNDNNIIEAPQVDSLDQLHEQTVHQLDAERIEADKEEPQPKEEPKEEPKDNKDEPAPEDKEEPEEKPEPEQKPEPKAEPEPELVIPELPELDTDITKNVEGKIAIKNSDGEMNYFNNLEEAPDDFEPASYKDFLRFSADMTRKQMEDEALRKQYEDAITQSELKKETDATIEKWDQEINVLKDSGVLPEDETERQDMINETYEFMSQKIREGVLIESFSSAFKEMQYDRLKNGKQEEKQEERQKVNTEKKERGSRIMGGSNPPASNNKAFEPLPAGLTLDQVHAKYSGLQ